MSRDDLATAIVDLGVGAEQRRHARKALRQAVEVVVQEILRHARTGDQVTIEGHDLDDDASFVRVYAVDRIDWLVSYDESDRDQSGFRADQPEPTLVQYSAIDTTEYTEWKAGAVLLDTRHEIFHVESDGSRHPIEVVGRDVFRVPRAGKWQGREIELHLATDAELAQFADDAIAVVQGMKDEFARTSQNYLEAADKLAKLAPK